MNSSDTLKAANLRRFLGIVLFAVLVGLGVSILNNQAMGSGVWLLGMSLVFFGGLALAAWGVVGGRYTGDTLPANTSVRTDDASDSGAGVIA